MVQFSVSDFNVILGLKGLAISNKPSKLLHGDKIFVANFFFCRVKRIIFLLLLQNVCPLSRVDISLLFLAPILFVLQKLLKFLITFLKKCKLKKNEENLITRLIIQKVDKQ